MSPAASTRPESSFHPPRKILHLEDNGADAELVRRVVEMEWPRCVVTACSNGRDFCSALDDDRYDVVLSDFTLPGFDGLTALKLAKERWPDTPFIFVSGTIGEDRAIEAVHQGADDWVIKDRMKRLGAVIRRALREAGERRRRKEAESRIREQAEMLNQAREAIVVVDLQGRVLYWNAGAERLFGWTAREVVNTSLMELFSADAFRSLEKAWFHTLASGSWGGELHLHHRNGKDVFVETHRTLIRDDEGLPKAHLSISTDITDKKAMQEKLLHVQRIENIGLLAAGITHDLNNMLAPIVMGAQLLRLSTSDPEALNWIRTIESSADRGVALVKQILAFTRSTTGERRRVEMDKLMTEMAGIVASTFPKTIVCTVADEPGLWAVRGNPTQLNQVLLNLCINARDAMSEGGALSLRANNCVVREDPASATHGLRPGPYVRLEVEDTGTGIPPDVQARMWEPFFTTKPAGLGTGLGLSTVRGIVENHGGFVSVRSTPGCGTCFTLHLPALDASIPDVASPPRAPSGGRGEFVLVVDDEEHVRTLTATLLARAGYRTATAANATEAVNQCMRHGAEVAVVISDTHMPGIDGPTLAGTLRRLHPGVKILAMSGLSTGSLSQWKADPAASFADGSLNKPFTPEQLLGAVERLVRGGPAAEETAPARS